jgi:hypothetical protein
MRDTAGTCRSFLRIEEASNPPSAQAEACLSGPLEGPGAGTAHCGAVATAGSGMSPERSPERPVRPDCAESLELCGESPAADESAGEGPLKEARPGAGRDWGAEALRIPGCESVSAHFQVS